MHAFRIPVIFIRCIPVYMHVISLSESGYALRLCETAALVCSCGYPFFAGKCHVEVGLPCRQIRLGVAGTCKQLPMGVVWIMSAVGASQIGLLRENKHAKSPSAFLDLQVWPRIHIWCQNTELHVDICLLDLSYDEYDMARLPRPRAVHQIACIPELQWLVGVASERDLVNNKSDCFDPNTYPNSHQNRITKVIWWYDMCQLVLRS